MGLERPLPLKVVFVGFSADCCGLRHMLFVEFGFYSD